MWKGREIRGETEWGWQDWGQDSELSAILAVQARYDHGWRVQVQRKEEQFKRY